MLAKENFHVMGFPEEGKGNGKRKGKEKLLLIKRVFHG